MHIQPKKAGVTIPILIKTLRQETLIDIKEAFYNNHNNKGNNPPVRYHNPKYVYTEKQF